MAWQVPQSIGILWLWRVSQYSWAECLGMCNNNYGSQHIASAFPVSGVALNILSVTFFLSFISILDLGMTRAYFIEEEQKHRDDEQDTLGMYVSQRCL